MVGLALADMARDFEVTLRSISWVIIIQGLTISAVMMPMGRLGDIIGRRKVYLIGLVIFGVGMAATALSTVFWFLIAARILSAFGNSMVQSVMTAMTVSVFPENERGKALGMQATLVATGLATGPVIAGIMLQFFSWQSIFWVMMVPIVASLILGLILLNEGIVSRAVPTKRPPFDWIGAVLSATAITLGITVINNPLAFSVISPWMIGGVVVLALTVALFIWWELRIDSPMLELRLFKNRQFTLASVARITGFMGQTAPFLLIPIFLITLKGIEAAAAGGMLFLTSIGMGVFAQVSGRLGDRFGERRFQVFGFGILTLIGLIYSTYTVDTPTWVIMIVLGVTGLGMGSWAPSNNSVMVGSAPRSAMGVVGALTNLVRNVGSVTGQAVAAAVVVGVMASQGFDIPLDEVSDTRGASSAFMTGFRYAFLLVAGIGFISMILAILAGSVEKDEVEQHSSVAMPKS
jgi:MFS family permease